MKADSPGSVPYLKPLLVHGFVIGPVNSCLKEGISIVLIMVMVSIAARRNSPGESCGAEAPRALLEAGIVADIAAVAIAAREGVIVKGARGLVRVVEPVDSLLAIIDRDTTKFVVLSVTLPPIVTPPRPLMVVTSLTTSEPSFAGVVRGEESAELMLEIELIAGVKLKLELGLEADGELEEVDAMMIVPFNIDATEGTTGRLCAGMGNTVVDCAGAAKKGLTVAILNVVPVTTAGFG